MNKDTQTQTKVVPGSSSIPDSFTSSLGSFDDWSVEQFPLGMVGPAASAQSYDVGAWRFNKPTWSKELCKNCMMCWMNCADTAVIMEDSTVGGVDFTHCKGCGVCEVECRFGAMVMHPEHGDDYGCTVKKGA